MPFASHSFGDGVLSLHSYSTNTLVSSVVNFPQNFTASALFWESRCFGKHPYITHPRKAIKLQLLLEFRKYFFNVGCIASFPQLWGLKTT
ncbi:CLUMA_CG003181, isoform A [Clunio marinus]|uniref:CLUMA_CG003181, isoform A n=1 Tax=Clunio marinus TaxID=568069 RepID=A0A1J1HN01_9DIPT|nr:CLUMA_CG003181, isoform A [Clunio marinus]